MSPAAASSLWNNRSKKKRSAPPPALSPLEVNMTMIKEADLNGPAWYADHPATTASSSPMAAAAPWNLLCACPRPAAAASHYYTAETPVASNRRQQRQHTRSGRAAQFFVFPSSLWSSTTSAAPHRKRLRLCHDGAPASPSLDQLHIMLDSLGLSTSSSSSSSSCSSLSSAGKTAKASNVATSATTTTTRRTTTSSKMPGALFSCTSPDPTSSNGRLEKERQRDWDLSVPTTDATLLECSSSRGRHRQPNRRRHVLRDNDPNACATMEGTAAAVVGSAADVTVNASSSFATTRKIRTSSVSPPRAAPGQAQGRHRASSAPHRRERTRRVIDSIIQNS